MDVDGTRTVRMAELLRQPIRNDGESAERNVTLEASATQIPAPHERVDAESSALTMQRWLDVAERSWD